MKREVCTGCSLLCDDIIVRSDGLFIDEIYGACLKGKEHFDQVISPNRILNPMIRKEGKLISTSWDEALNKTIELIKKSKDPIFYGFSTVTSEAQLKGLELARIASGYIDSNSSICHGQVLDVAKKTGISLTTLSEIINKADLIILWGANAAESIPRLLGKIVFSRGKFRMTGREIKTLIIIDPVKTASFNVMGVRDIALRIEPGKDIDLIRILKEECCAENSIPEKGIAGIDKSDLKRLLVQLTNAEYGVIILGQGILQANQKLNVIEELLELVEMINNKQERGRISLMTMGGHSNMVGFDQMTLTFYGKRGGIKFENGNPIDSDDNIISKITRDNFDLMFVVGSDPIAHFPKALSSKIAKKPLIVIDNKKSATTMVADVVLPSSITGIESGGLMFRLDMTPINVKPIIKPPSNVLSDQEILEKLIEKFKGGGR